MLLATVEQMENNVFAFIFQTASHIPAFLVGGLWFVLIVALILGFIVEKALNL